PCSLIMPFSFCSSSDHRYLHPFPTRRSSDLLRRGHPRLRQVSKPSIQAVSRAREAAFLRAAANCGESALDLSENMRIIRSYAFEDRKSTRLNSSHVSISYAVFCLKKKKNEAV